MVTDATSTLDSAAAALQMLTGSRRRTLALGVLAAVSWPLVTSMGIVALWTAYASVRVFIVARLLAAAWYRTRTTTTDTHQLTT